MPKKHLKTIAGIRTFATLWIVLGHFQDTAFRYDGDETFLLVLNRGYVGVAIYIVLSGFITHYAYKDRTYDNWQAWASFYLRRVGRVVFTYEASCILGLLDPLFTRHEALASEYPLQAISNCLLIQSWFEFPNVEGFSRDWPNSPNPGGWTISTLLMAWLVYPFLNKFMRMYASVTNNSIAAKAFLGVLLYLVVMFPFGVIFASHGGVITNQEFEFLYKFPPLRLFDFWIGMVAAEFVGDVRVNESCFWKIAPDLVAIGFILFVSLVTLEDTDFSSVPEGVEQPLIRENLEAVLISGLSPFIAFMLLGYSINSGRGDIKFSMTGLFEHPVCESLGGFSFAIYCFQFTIFFMFEQWQFNNTGINALAFVPEVNAFLEVPARLVSGYLMPFLVVLVCFSAWWTLWLERPFAAKLAEFCKGNLDPPVLKTQHSVRQISSAKLTAKSYSQKLSKKFTDSSGEQNFLSFYQETARDLEVDEIEHGYLSSPQSAMTMSHPTLYDNSGRYTDGLGDDEASDTEDWKQPSVCA